MPGAGSGPVCKRASGACARVPGGQMGTPMSSCPFVYVDGEVSRDLVVH